MHHNTGLGLSALEIHQLIVRVDECMDEQRTLLGTSATLLGTFASLVETSALLVTRSF